MGSYSSSGTGERNNGGAREERGREAMGEGVLFLKVMTDEQMEILRRQIAAYATICEQLVEMHKAVTAQRDSLAGMRLGGVYDGPLISSSGQNIVARQRWTPTAMQLQILETMFNEGKGTPRSKQKIKQITNELSRHGQISESNVYNWFQNRKARAKRKQMVALASNTESEVKAEDGNDNSHNIRQLDDGVHSLAPQLNQMQGIEQMMSKFDMPSFSPYHCGENYGVN